MKISSDWHIHSHNSCDCIGTGMSVAEIVATAARKGVTDLGLTDHLHTPFNLPTIRASREEYWACEPGTRFHFGVEVSCVTEWELREIAQGGHESPTYGLREGGPAWSPLAIGLTGEDVDELGIEYVVGGTHCAMYVPYEREAWIRDYHRQNMFLATHELVDIVAHPWWFFTGYWLTHCERGEPWIEDFGRIPESMHDEFAAALVEHATAAEINIGAILLKDESKYPGTFKRQYLEYVAMLKSRGVQLSLGSDAHHHEQYATMDFERAAAMLDIVGITEDDLWTLPAREE